MSKQKVVDNGYITAIGVGLIGEDITDDEYNQILGILQTAPSAEGKGYRLKTDLTWEEFDIEEPVIDDDDELSEEDALAILMGGEL